MKVVKEEVAGYKASPDKTRTKYKIVSEEIQPEGSVIIKLINHTICSLL